MRFIDVYKEYSCMKKIIYYLKMSFKHKYKKYKQKYNYLVKSGSYNDII